MANSNSERAKVTDIRTMNRFKQSLVKEGVISKEKLWIAEATANREKQTLSRTLIRLGFISEEQLARFVGDRAHVPYVDIKNYTIDRTVLEMIPEKVARSYRVIPLFKIENVLTIAMSDPMDIISADDISKVAGCRVEPAIASAESINIAIDQWYGAGEARTKLVEELAEEFKEIEPEIEKEGVAEEIEEIHLKREAEEPPIIKLVNSYIAQAMIEGASDIHFEPKRGCMLIRYRIDGFLYERQRLPGRLAAPITSRIKIMSGLDITKRKIPQDGRIGLVIRNRNIDVRTSTFPTMYGENIVLRILDKSRGVPTMGELGFSGNDLKTFGKLIRATKGIILSTGPTGSGKTTTIYSAINAMDKLEKNIMTIEDPIEYEIEGIVQSQVNLKAGVTFATALRSILRQDPDVIYVGEIRDLETAEIAVRAALTGHLVLSTLHTNDSVGAITRLLDIGVEAGLIETVLNCSFAQRLLRKVCVKCRQEYQPDKELLIKLGLSPDAGLYKSRGCEFCGGIGYRGRIGIFEILNVGRDIRGLISRRSSEKEIMEAARERGMCPLFEDGLKKAASGLTTLDEVRRVTEEELVSFDLTL